MHKVAKEIFNEHLGFDEPMPDFNSRFPNRLESCLNQPFVGFSNVNFYRGLLKKAVALFYFCIKDHPFENGNKRFAVTMMLYFLYKNHYWLEIDPVKLYEIAKLIANSQEKPQQVIDSIVAALRPHVKHL